MVTVKSIVETGHADMIHDAQMDYYGIKLATASSDRSVKIFEVDPFSGSHTLSADLQGHEGPVWQVAWAHPSFSNILASCSYDRKVIIWKEDESEGGKWRVFHEYSGHDSSVNSVSWAHHELGLLLAAGSSDGSISLLSFVASSWESSKITTAHTIGCNAVSWSPNSLRFVSGGCDNLVKIWRFEDEVWVEEAKLEGHSDWVRDVAWAPSVGLKKNVIASCSQDQRVIIWTRLENDGVWTPKTLNAFPDVVWHVSWSITGNMLAVSCGDNKVSLWKENLEGIWICISDLPNSSQG